MDTILFKIVQIWNTKSLRHKLLFTLFIIFIYRLASHIPVPGIDLTRLKFVIDSAGDSSLGIFSMLTGGAMANFSILFMGLSPYINASIIIQLLSVMVPSLDNLKKEGDAGQRKISQYTRLLTVPIAFFQSYGMITLMNTVLGTVVVDTSNMSIMLPMMLIMTAGTVLLMWLGELINERGIGNGVSIIIFAGIVAALPSQILGSMSTNNLPITLALLIATLALLVFVVYVSEANRNVPVMYANRKTGGEAKSFLPLKINQVGMIPIIFASSLVMLPNIIAQFLSGSTNVNVQLFIVDINKYFNPNDPSFIYNVLYALLIFGFTFFYLDIMFDSNKVADNIQKRGGFLPGLRPGDETASELHHISRRLGFWGALFLTFVAIIPVIVQNYIGGGASNVALFMSGAALIIIVGVVLDIIRRINAQLIMQDYDSL